MGVPRFAVVYTIGWFKIHEYKYICYQLAPFDFCKQMQLIRQSRPFVRQVVVVGEKNRQCLTALEEEKLMNATNIFWWLLKYYTEILFVILKTFF